MEKKNQPCYNKDGEFLGWFSPSIAVSTFVFLHVRATTYILATKRGVGCPNNVGKWNCQCGYLEFGESTSQAAVREVYEETGIELSDKWLIDWRWTDEPDENDNIIHIFTAALFGDMEDYPTTSKHSDTDEVAEIKWIPIDDIDKYEWAFNHDKIIKEIFKFKYTI